LASLFNATKDGSKFLVVDHNGNDKNCIETQISEDIMIFPV
jgi:hypothetical protein